MTCLLYGIVFSQSGGRGSGHPPPGLPPGVGGAPVRLIVEGGPGAAVSWVRPPDPHSAGGGPPPAWVPGSGTARRVAGRGEPRADGADGGRRPGPSENVYAMLLDAM